MNGKKVKFNLFIDDEDADKFDDFCAKVPGKKTEKVTAALKSLQALCLIDRDILFDLMSPGSTVESVKELILQSVRRCDESRIFASLTKKQRDHLILLAREAEKSLKRL